MRVFHRRKYLIDKYLQLRIIAVSVAYVALYIIITAAAAFVPIIIQMRLAEDGSYQAYSLAKNFLYLHQYIWPAALLILIAVCIHSLLFSHKIAGPIYRFKQVFLSLKEGKVPGPQRLRKADFLKPELKLINEMLEGLQSRISSLREIQKAIAASTEGIVQRSPALSDRELTVLVGKLDAQVKRLAEHELLIKNES